MDIPVLDIKGTGSNIKKAITDSGMKKKDVATTIGLSDKSTLYKYMRGDTMPSIDMLIAIAAVTGSSLDQLVAVA